ncbi:MAG: TonB-dependent receptor, partial [Pseudomonadota bacterium]
MQRHWLILFVTLFINPAYVLAHSIHEEITVTGHRVNLISSSVSASQGLVGQTEIEVRPILRTGEILELVPGMVVTQHSGTGKANQYFLRGFNLDHGTDFNTSIDHMPVNMRTHGHGQGYTDINFIIPELVAEIAYQKGPYYAEVGDFSGAGAASFRTVERLEENLLSIGLGKDNFQRLLTAHSTELGNDSTLLFALEAQRYDGPWSDIEEDLKKLNAVARYSRPLGLGNFSLMFMGYDNRWDAADQIPQRAVTQGLIDRLGSLDTAAGGQSSRHSLSAQWHNQHWDITAYAIRYQLDLWSNFTYFLDDPVNGDQFQQVDDRWVYGATGRHLFTSQFANFEVDHILGVQARFDAIDEVGLYRTQARRRIGTVRSDEVDEWSLAAYWQGTIQFTPDFRAILGLRYDHYDFDVNDILAVNSGHTSDGIASMKLNLGYQLDDDWEFYVGVGQGFHSNDARGTVIRTDPLSGELAEPVDPLARSEGAEIGLRFFRDEYINASLSIWWLRLDSELIFVGDAGNTEATRSSRRRGVELTTYYYVNDHWTVDLEAAWSRARFDEATFDEGDRIEGSLPLVLSTGLTFNDTNGWFGSL